MANCINKRRQRQVRDPHSTTCSTDYIKGVRGSYRHEKREWNGRVRRDGKRFCTDFRSLYGVVTHSLVRFTGEPRCEDLVYNLRPWMD